MLCSMYQTNCVNSWHKQYFEDTCTIFVANNRLYAAQMCVATSSMQDQMQSSLDFFTFGLFFLYAGWLGDLNHEHLFNSERNKQTMNLGRHDIVKYIIMHLFYYGQPQNYAINHPNYNKYFINKSQKNIVKESEYTMECSNLLKPLKLTEQAYESWSSRASIPVPLAC